MDVGCAKQGQFIQYSDAFTRRKKTFDLYLCQHNAV